MNLREFESHRPILYRQLRGMLESEDFAGNWEFGWSIVPMYEGDIKFRATHPVIDPLVCVGQDHPKSMLESDAPGSLGTWWWEDDLLST